MEEKKVNETKTVEMKAVKGGAQKEQKLTYEQLNEACNQLFQQNQQLRKQVNELNSFNAFKRLDYLFKVVEHSSAFNDAEFTSYCIDEIKDAMIIKDAEDTETKAEE